MLPHDVLAAFCIPAFLVLVGMENRDQVVQLATAQRIVHEMSTRTGPQHNVGTPEVPGDLLALEHGTIGNVAGHARLAVTDHTLPNLRPHAITSDQRPAFGDFSVIERH